MLSITKRLRIPALEGTILRSLATYTAPPRLAEKRVERQSELSRAFRNCRNNMYNFQEILHYKLLFTQLHITFSQIPFKCIQVTTLTQFEIKKICRSSVYLGHTLL